MAKKRNHGQEPEMAQAAPSAVHTITPTGVALYTRVST